MRLILSLRCILSRDGFHAQYVRGHVNRSSRNQEVIPKCKGGSLAARITGFNYESRENFDEVGEAAGGD